MSDISRRGFLGGVAAGAATLLGSRPGSAHEHFAGYPGRMGLLHDTTLCVGCSSWVLGSTKKNRV